MKLIRTICCLLLLAGSVQAQKGGNRPKPRKPSVEKEEPKSSNEGAEEKSAAAETTSDADGPSKKRSWFRLGKKDEEQIAADEAAANAPVFHLPKTLEGIDFPVSSDGAIANDPWQKLWGSPGFQRAWMGRYAFHPNVEPEITSSNELAFMRELGPLLKPDAKLAAYILKTNLTATNNAQMDFTLGSLYFQMGDFPKAEDAFRTAIDKYPDFRRAQKNLAFSLLKQGKYADAVDPLSKTIELGDRDSTSYGLLGFCHMTAERNIPAEAAYKQAILFQPDNPDWRLGLVKALVAQEKFEEANRMVEEVLQRDPAAVDMWELQAGIFARMEKPELAAVNYEIIRKLGKADPKMLFALGDIYMTMESSDLALPVYLDAIKRNGSADISRALRTSQILVSHGALDEAKKMFAQIRSSAGNELKGDDELTLLKAESKVANAEGEPEKAVKILETVVERDPLDAEALILIGEHYLRNEELEKAEHRFDLASKVAGYEADAFVKLAQLRVKQQKLRCRHRTPQQGPEAESARYRATLPRGH